MTPIALAELEALDRDGFAAALDGIFEHAPEVAAQAWEHRPFGTVASLHAALAGVVDAWPEARQLAFIRAHPDLAGRAARAGTLIAHSAAEQRGLGLDALDEAQSAMFERLNDAYRSRFGFPFVICVARRTRDAILREYDRRLANDPATERRNALDEIGLITRLRLASRVTGPGMPRVHGRLTTHVLDTTRGRPAPGVAVELHELGGEASALIAAAVTNADGRTEPPLLGGAPLRIGTYELRFALGAYFRGTGALLAEPPFLDVVPIRFAIAEPEGHYHVPLLASPWSFSTYRGS